MDGNGRWARRRGLPPLAGHRAGTTALRRTVEAAPDLGVRSLAVYAFSTENWGRPGRRRSTDLMALFAETIREQFPDLHRQGVRVHFVGRRDRCPDEPARADGGHGAAHRRRTAASTCGSRSTTAAATRSCAAARSLVGDGVDPEAIDEQALRAHLYAPEMPDPDLVIRTSGELRISNFLLWQAAYAELHFTPTLWPDFGEDELREALRGLRRPPAAVRPAVSALVSRVVIAVPLAALAVFAVYVGGWLMTGAGARGGGRDRDARVLPR